MYLTMRKAHYIKLASATMCPGAVIAFDTETHLAAGSTDVKQIHTLTLGTAIYYRRENGRRTRVKELTFYDSFTFWDWLKSNLSKDRTTWIFAHNAGYDLGIVNAWQEFSSNPEWGFERVIVERGIVLLDGEYEGKKVIFSDTGNYWKASLASIGQSVGRKKLDMPNTAIPNSELKEYCRNDTLIVADAVDAICSFVEKENFGPFGPTAASLAFNTWRKSFMSHKVLVHVDKDALELEREAYYGGIVDTPYIGVVPEYPIYELDVVSMYPSVCMGNLPCTLKGVYDEVNLSRLEHVLFNYMVIGRVHLSSNQPLYPVRIDSGTVYPIGDFISTLADAEFRQAWSRGHIRKVERVAVYDGLPLFRDYMEFFLTKKVASGKTDGAANTALYKLMLNSLYGKMGQLTPRWVKSGKEAERYLEQLHKLPDGALAGFLPTESLHPVSFWQLSIPKYNLLFDMRSIFGVVEINTVSTETRDSCPAIAACVTSAARVKLRSYQEIVGKRNYYYSDTDSIWVNREGYYSLVNTGAIGDNPGDLQLKGKCNELVVYGRKDYHAHEYSKWDGVSWSAPSECIKRKGIKKGAIQLSPDTFIQEHWPGIVAQLQSGQRGVVEVQRIGKTLHRSITHCIVGADGWTEPFDFTETNTNE